jgi:hypothetical protein
MGHGVGLGQVTGVLILPPVSIAQSSVQGEDGGCSPRGPACLPLSLPSRGREAEDI